ncbi:hypothetical protein Rumeso_04279 [Rubellimicrobium mesophilum DSM 19309]|uniref:Uncharacterized protein n=1 Tax=Rubellimicrobium mesophilum DSM 19309 TaxID=442562 RepID=A0A017HI86_9RHOB|nr:hypothetical protein [Rubellimicrobium mesophilum]EYD74222.1 hypothetical protein Rumeso_04279 [Rubellimicrobium mesophilum DSM 19309]
MRAARLGLGLLAVAAAPAMAAETFLQVANRSNLTIMEIYASPAGKGTWDEDLLVARVLPRGETGTFVIPERRPGCTYDLRLVFENGREAVQATDACSGRGHVVREAP